MGEPVENDTASESIRATRIEVVTADQANFASHQNAVPFLREFAIRNMGDQELSHLTLSLDASPSFMTSKRWSIEALPAGAELKIKDRNVTLSGQFLLELTEAVSGEAIFVLRNEHDEELCREVKALRVLARNEWGGVSSSPELLAAFSQPNDPVVDKILAKAAKILEATTPGAKLNGYQSGKRTFVWATAAAIWSAVGSLGIRYSVPPASFEATGQKIRSPSMIVEGGLATCLDTTMLFCSSLEQAGLRPIVLIAKGHAFAGVWLQPEHFSTTITEDITAVRKRIALQELIVFETTLITEERPPLFRVAIDQAQLRLDPEHESEFVHAIDVQRARDQRIRPISLGAQPTGEPSDASDERAPIHEQAPDLPDFDQAHTNPDLATLNPTDRLDAWQRRLLDLSARNPLLNHRAGPSSLTLLCHDAPALEDLIGNGTPVQIKPLPIAPDRDSEVHEQQTGKILEREILQAGFARNEIYVKAPKEAVERGLVELYRKARADLEEGGANTLFLAIGLLVWKRPDSEKKYRAPLLLVPVELKRRSARTLPYLQSHDDETRFNPTLIEMLRQDFDVTLPEFQAGLPRDNSGVDVTRIFHIVRSKVKEIDGFDVIEDIVLSTFSFAKFLMWKDLVERTDNLRLSPVVKHLLDTPRDQYARGEHFPEPRDLDRLKEPKELFLPIDYDSSQLSAIVASAEEGRDFVLIGPPGTGKSQSIANMIAHNVALGRKVLFVAEKRAALEVVYRRLNDVGLSPFCLELHSNKAKKRDVLNQLSRAWDVAETHSQVEWEQEAAQLKSVRDKLNVYVDALHREHRNGLSVHRAIGVECSFGRIPGIDFAFASTDAHDAADLKQLRAAAHRMDVEANALGDIATHPLRQVRNGEWSNSWQAQVVNAARSVFAAIDVSKRATDEVLRVLGIPDYPVTPRTLPIIAAVASALMDGAKFRVAWCLSADGGNLIDRLGEACRTLTDYRSTEQQLSVSYKAEAWRKIDFPSCEANWNLSKQAWWPKSYLAARKAIKLLQLAAGSKEAPKPQIDLPLVEKMARDGQRLDALSAQLAKVPGWEAFITDVEKASETVSSAKRLRGGLFSLIGASPLGEPSVGRSVTLLDGGDEALGEHTAAGSALKTFVSAHADLMARLRNLQELTAAPQDFIRDDEEIWGGLKSCTQAIIDHERAMNQWCSWWRARSEAVTLGLGSLVEAIETGSVPIGTFECTFDAAYCRWWATRKIDEDPSLRLFSASQHEDLIAQFRAIDGRVRKLTAQYIKARLCKNVPRRTEIEGLPHFAILSREIQKQARHMAVRELFTQAGDVLPTLAPCVLMSPLSVAQYLPADLKLFDLVIFDEASQITVWDAVGAIARGKQTVVAGDPNQMPPTNFFARDQNPLGDDSDIEEDADSILDEMAAAGIPRRSLTWHYRSQSEGLIAFSNSEFYDGGLITFAAPNTHDTSVRLHFVEDGVYLRGKDQTNQREAKAVVDYAVRLLRDPEFMREKRSLGIVSFNSKQQTLIQNLLDAACKAHPEIERYFADEITEPVFVKNLESVQGDERDIILFSITFGKDEAGAMAMTFGPLNQSGGWRRLNVAVTRARRQMIVFSSIKAEHIDLSRTQAEGVQALKNFLDYAERGVIALGTAASKPRGDYDSPFEASVANALRQRGWTIHSQIGVGPFRVDLGVVHPSLPGRYLAAVECDGATYHRCATARDRDIVRQGVLERLGWKILRIWSTDYWVNPNVIVDRLHERLNALLLAEKSDEEQAGNEEPSDIETDDTNLSAAILNADANENETPEYPLAEGVAEAAATLAPETRVEPFIGRTNSTGDFAFGVYRTTNAEDLAVAPNAERFYDSDYGETLRSIIESVLRIEGPIHEEILAFRVARLHGFARTGNQILKRVSGLARRVGHARKENVGTFFWLRDTDPATYRRARRPMNEEARRLIEHICREEITAFLTLTAGDGDPIISAARNIGIHRLSPSARARLEAIQKLTPPDFERTS